MHRLRTLGLWAWMASIAIGSPVVALGNPAGGADGKHGPVPWHTSLTEAGKIAAKQHKILLVDFYAEWCGPCQAMLKTTYRDKSVLKQMTRFVPVLIDVDKDTKLAQKYGVEAVPTTLFLTADGRVLRSETGYHSPEEFLKLTNDVLAKVGKPSAPAAHGKAKKQRAG